MIQKKFGSCYLGGQLSMDNFFRLLKIKYFWTIKKIKRLILSFASKSDSFK